MHYYLNDFTVDLPALKGIDHSKLKILYAPPVFPNLNGFLSSVNHKISYFENVGNQPALMTVDFHSQDMFC